MAHTSRHGSDEENRFTAKKLAFDENDGGLGMQTARPPFNSNVSGYNSSAASRSGSLPPSRSDVDTSTRHPGELQNLQYPRLNPPATQRPNMSAQASTYTMPARVSGQRHTGQLSPSHLNQMLGDFGTLSVGKENHSSYSNQSEVSYGTPPHAASSYSQEMIPDGNEIWDTEENGYQSQQDQFPSTGGSSSLTSNSATRRGIGFGASYAHSPNIGGARLSHTSPYYSAAGTPPSYQQRAPSRGGFSGPLVTGQAAVLDRKLRGLQQEQQAYMVPRPTPMHFNNQPPHPSTYDFQLQPGLRMNQLNAYYQMPPLTQHMAASHIPRGPASDHPVVQPVRSALLEDFRNNSKTNKRYELKVRLCGPGLLALR